MTPDSRYIDADSEFVAAHTYDAGGVRESRDSDGGPNVHTRQTLYRLQVLPLPDPPETTYMAKVTDSFPLQRCQMRFMCLLIYQSL